MPSNQIGWEVLTVSTSAVTLTPGTAKHALIRVTGAPVRWRADGTAPTATVGMFADINQFIEFMEVHDTYSGILRSIQFVRDTSAGSDASLEVAYFD